jgi:hypothetical protein
MVTADQANRRKSQKVESPKKSEFVIEPYDWLPNKLKPLDPKYKDLIQQQL